MANAYEYLENYRKNPKNLQCLLGQVDFGSSGMALSQTDKKEDRRELIQGGGSKKLTLLSPPLAPKLSADIEMTRTTSRQNVAL
jgi:hypothetical protein